MTCIYKQFKRVTGKSYAKNLDNLINNFPDINITGIAPDADNDIHQSSFRRTHLIKINRDAEIRGNAFFDGFYFDNKSKCLLIRDTTSYDKFADDFNGCYGGNTGLSVRNGNLTLNGRVLINAENSRITGIDLPELKTMRKGSLRTAHHLKTFRASKLTSMEGSSLVNTKSLTEFYAPELRTMGFCCLKGARNLKKFIACNLTTMKEGCLMDAVNLRTFRAPNLISMGTACLENARRLQNFTAQSLKSMADRCLQNAVNLRTFRAPNLISIGENCLRYARALKRFTASNLESAGRGALKFAYNSLMACTRKPVQKYGHTKYKKIDATPSYTF